MQNFEQLPGLIVDTALRNAFAADDITVATTIQILGIPPILEGRHVLLQSGTGTGKTLAYLLPVLQRLSEGAAKRAVVLAPSAELAMQTLRIADRYKRDDITTGALVATGSHKQQKANVHKSTRLIAGTPGRVLEMYRARKMKNVNILVLDEPDPILTGKDADFLLEVISRPEPRLQVVVVGATIGPPAERLIATALADCVRVRAEDNPLHGPIRHLVVGVRQNDSKDVRLARFIDKHHCKRAVLFVGQERLVGHLYRYLSEHGHNPVSLSPGRPKHEHKAALQKFNNGEAQMLVTSDSAARGLDFADVPWVLSYDVPQSAPAYVHRAGRTARAGRQGTSVSFCWPKERARLKAFAKELNLQIEFEG